MLKLAANKFAILICLATYSYPV